MTQTMGSREIAELCGKSHRHVLRDVEKLNLNYERLSLPKIEQGYYTTPKTGSQQHREFYLTKEQTLDLVTGYNVDIRIKINRRWLALEQAVANVAYHEDLRLQFARKEVLERLEQLDHAEQLLRQAEEARQKVLAELGDLSEFDQRMIAKYGDKYPIRQKAVATKLENMMVVTPERTQEEMLAYLTEGLEDDLD